MQDAYQALISLSLPDLINDFFEMKGVRKEYDISSWGLEDVNVLPQEDVGAKILSWVSYADTTMQVQVLAALTIVGKRFLISAAR